MKTKDNGQYIGVEESDPLKQGLKRDWQEEKTWELYVEESDPLKQGLKLQDSYNVSSIVDELKRAIH